jgi:hypothetical protein
MGQTVTLTMQGTVVETDGTSRSFENRYVHRLWMPRDLADILEICGFARPRILPADGRTGPADGQCWKILFATTARAAP